MLAADIDRMLAKTPTFVSRLHVERVGGTMFIVYPAQDGKFRYAFLGGTEPQPSEPFDVRYQAIKAAREAAR